MMRRAASSTGLVIAWALVFAGVGRAEGDLAEGGSAAALRAIVAPAVESGEVIGLSVAVMRGDEPVLVEAFGQADHAAGLALTPDTPLRIASVSKLVTAALATRLHEAGVVSLDAELGEYLPELRNALPAGVTLRRSVNHTTGVPDYLAAAYERLEAEGGPLTEEWTLDWVRAQAPLFAAGERWAYSNTAFYLAAIAMERASGRSWAELIRDEIASPLGLDTLQPCDALIVRNELRGFTVTDDGVAEDPFYVEQGVKGDGGLCVTAVELARLGRALERGELVSGEGFAAMLTPTTLTNGVTVDYGLGLRRGELGGRRVWGHTGSIGAYIATMMRFPDDDLTVVVLQNTGSAETGALTLAGYLAEESLNLPPANWPEPTLPAEFARYVGTYEARGEGGSVQQIRVADEGWLERVRSDLPSVPLIPAGDGWFGRADWPRDPVRFHDTPGAEEAVGFSVYSAGLFTTYYWRVEDHR